MVEKLYMRDALPNGFHRFCMSMLCYIRGGFGGIYSLGLRKHLLHSAGRVKRSVNLYFQSLSGPGPYII